MRVRLTDRLIANCRTTSRAEYWDTLVPGFGLRVSARTKTFWVRARHQGERIRVKIGRYPAWSLHDARAEALTILGTLGRGIDPRSQLDSSLSFGDLIEQYLGQSRMREVKTADTIRRICERDIIPTLGSRPAADIRRSEIIAVLESIQRRANRRAMVGVVMRNRTLSIVSRVFKFGLLTEVISANPCALIPKLTEHPRERVLTDGELRRLWPIWEADPQGPMFQLLLLTAQRPGEVRQMKWTDLWDDWWMIPTSKNRRSNAVFLAPATQSIIESERETSDYLFSGKRSEWVFPGRRIERPIATMSTAMQRYREKSDIHDWTPHDLRRTAATKMVEIDVPPRTVEEILNHKQPGITEKHYLRANYRSKVQAALEQWAIHLTTEIVGRY